MRFHLKFFPSLWRLFIALVFLLAACQAPGRVDPVLLPGHTPVAPSITPFPPATASPFPTATLIPSPTHTPTLTLTPTITLTPEPPGCQAPPEDYERLEVNGWVLNRRTMAMLEQAASLYNGELEITGYHITQGSYHDNGSASFGTHLGGGAVDLSVIRKGTWQVLWDDIDSLILALRTAGFAAWLRDLDELYPGSAIHIHAVAIGDKELSTAAQDQLTGPHGYFYGYTGIPYGDPAPDRHGGSVVCQWMIDAGYRDLRE